MPTSLFVNVNLDYIYPPFRDRLLEVIARLSARGHIYRATSGYRSWGDQMALWAKGRTAPGAIVTNAKGGQSQHNFGLAIDFTCIKNGKVSWDTKDYEPLSDELVLASLHSGSAYKDWPHAGWGEFTSGGRLIELAKVFTSSKLSDDLTKLQEVWDYVTANSSPLRSY
jgi:hypothetical protein